MPSSICTSAPIRGVDAEHSCVLFQSLPFATPFYGRTDIQENFTQHSTPVCLKRGGTTASAEEIVSDGHCTSATMLDSLPTSVEHPLCTTAPSSSFLSPTATARTSMGAPPDSLVRAATTTPLCSADASLYRNAEKDERTSYQANRFRGRHLLGVKVELPQDYAIALFTEVNGREEDEEKKKNRGEASTLERKQQRYSSSAYNRPESHSSLSSSRSLQLPFSVYGDGFRPRRVKRLRLETTSVPVATPSSSLFRPDPSQSPSSSALPQGKHPNMVDDVSNPQREKHRSHTQSGNESFDVPFASPSFLVWGHDRLPESNSKAVQWIQLAKEIHGIL